jgi:hypothetical protein
MLELVSPECRGLVSRKAETVQKSVQDVVNRMLDTLTNMISSSILPETEGSNVHPVTRAVVKGIGLLFQNREKFYSYLQLLQST